MTAPDPAIARFIEDLLLRTRRPDTAAPPGGAGGLAPSNAASISAT